MRRISRRRGGKDDDTQETRFREGFYATYLCTTSATPCCRQDTLLLVANKNRRVDAIVAVGRDGMGWERGGRICIWRDNNTCTKPHRYHVYKVSSAWSTARLESHYD
jgi:hypothetical protein